MAASSVNMRSTVCEFPVGIRNRVTVSIVDYKTLKEKIIHSLISNHINGTF